MLGVGNRCRHAAAALAVVRAMVDNELSEYVARVHELRKAAGQ